MSQPTPPDDDLPREHDLPCDDDDQEQELSFEELGQAYAQALAETGDDRYPGDDAAADLPPATDAGHLAAGSWPAGAAAALLATAAGDSAAEPGDAGQGSGDRDGNDEGDDEPPPTPLAIIEAALFIGAPDNRAISEQELAGLMRDVTVTDVQQYVARLNESYVANGQALRIYADADGLRMSISPDMELVRRSFYGKIRETRLSQHAIEVLSLVAYQPGITAERVQQQRGKESLSILNQLVRRRLLEQQRTIVEGKKKPLVTYQPSERFLQLFGLDSLADLPQVDG